MLEAAGLLPSKPPVFGQGLHVRINTTRAPGVQQRWATGDEAMVIRRWPGRGMHDKVPDDDLYEVQLISKNEDRLYFTFKELEVAA